MNAVRPSILLTGVSGNIGSRLVPLLQRDFDIIGVGTRPPQETKLSRFESIDLGKEPSCEQLVRLLRDTCPTAVVHLAFLTDSHRAGNLTADRMWRINVLGTARVMEAIAETNRHNGGVRKFICPLSATAYGPDTPLCVNEDHPLAAHTLPSAVQHQEADAVVRYRSDTMGDCNTYLLRNAMVAGATVQNYLVDAIRAVPLGSGSWAERMRRRNRRLPFVTDMGKQSPERQLQFVHVDDVARLIAHIVARDKADPTLTVLNVSGRDESVTFAEVAEMAGAKVMHLPRWMALRLLRVISKLNVATIPVEALPYLLGSCTVDTARLKSFLGSDYQRVIQYTVSEALADTFKNSYTLEEAARA